MLGPSAAVGAGSLLVIMEKQVDYVVAATLKLQRERLKSIEVKPEAVADFDAYLESYFPAVCSGYTLCVHCSDAIIDRIQSKVSLVV